MLQAFLGRVGGGTEEAPKGGKESHEEAAVGRVGEEGNGEGWHFNFPVNFFIIIKLL